MRTRGENRPGSMLAFNSRRIPGSADLIPIKPKKFPVIVQMI
jgi:hypothetical protein